MKASAGEKKKGAIDVVAEDRNWVDRIQNELKCAAVWTKDWFIFKIRGFLAAGAENMSIDNATKEFTIDDQINMLQNKLNSIKVGPKNETSNQQIGKYEPLEKFNNREYNIVKNELRPQDRRLPKGWKKEKWTPPVDEFDPLSRKKK